MENKTLEEIAADVKVIREMVSKGTMLQDITTEMGLSEEYIRDIMLCIQGYGGEDDDLAIARLMMM